MELERAQESLQAAELCLQAGWVNSAVSRAYYAMFQAAQVALEMAGFTHMVWSHPSTAWQKSPRSLRGEGTPLIGPFERFGHRCVKVRDERQDAGA